MVTLLATRPESVPSYLGRTDSEDASEFYHYEDNGCVVSDSCLDCPLPKCRYDDPVWFQRNRKLAKDFRMLQVMQQESLTIEETAERVLNHEGGPCSGSCSGAARLPCRMAPANGRLTLPPDRKRKERGDLVLPRALSFHVQSRPGLATRAATPGPGWR